MNEPNLRHAEGPPQTKPLSLADFIEANHKLITVLGVFTAITAFSGSLPIQPFAQAISALFLTLTLLVWLELWGRFPSSVATWTMYWFESILGLAMLALVAYWVFSIRSVFPPFVVLLVFMLVTGGFSYLLKRFDVFNRTFRTRPGGRRFLRYLVGILILGLGFAIALLITALIFPPLDRLIAQLLGIPPLIGE
jgi:small-conductance mechanosensitive channel